jgi:choline dehydrogenase-like flavoprotein
MASEFDDGIVVIGGGPCAAVAARELVRAGHAVTMLDAGSRAPRGITVRMADRTVFRWVEPGMLLSGRQRAASRPDTQWWSSWSFGGLTNYWTGAVPRFAPDDFTEGAVLDERMRWPIGYADLEPFYELIEDDMQIAAGGPLANVPAGRVARSVRTASDWRELAARASGQGYSLAAVPLAKGKRWMVALRPREFTSHHCIVQPFASAPNFRLVADARVLSVDYSATRSRATSATYFDRRTSAIKQLHGRAFVVAAGPLDSTEILLRSVSGEFPDGLGNTYGVLGRYLHDHPREWWTARLQRPLTAPSHPLYLSRAPLDESAPLFAASHLIGAAGVSGRLAALANRRVSQLGVQVLATMVPEEDSRVALVPGWSPDDASSALRIDIAYDSATVANVYQARDRFREMFAAVGNPVELGPFHELAPGSAIHYAGTVRMHRRPEFGVLDDWNRVHDVPNVVVADASAFTTGPEKNPTLTAMAIAARAARRLAIDAA